MFLRLPQISRPLRSGLVLLALVLPLAACSTINTTAVAQFAAQAPDAAKLKTLTAAYGNVPKEMLQISEGLSDTQKADWQQQVKQRKDQIKAINALHSSLIGYMTVLGTLAGDKIVDTSTEVTALTDAVGTLQESGASLGISTEQLSAANTLATSVSEMILKGYRQKKLKKAIAKGHAYLPQVIVADKKITTDIMLSLLALKGKLAALRIQTLNTLKSDGVTDGSHSATGFLFKKAIDADIAENAKNLAAAKAYIKALDHIAKAYEEIYTHRDTAFTADGAKALLAKIRPDLAKAYGALQILANL